MRASIQTVLLGVVVMLMAQSDAFAQDASHFLELLVTLDHGSLTLVQHTIRPGQVPRQNLHELLEGLCTVQAEDATGHILYLAAIHDPRVRHVDAVDQATTMPGKMQAHSEMLSRTTFAVSIPYDRAITRLRLFRLRRTVDASPMAPRSVTISVSSGGLQSSFPSISIPADALELIGTLDVTVP